MVLDDDYILLDRLERAEHLVRAELVSYRLVAKRYELHVKQLAEQADILRHAQIELLKKGCSDS